MKALRLTETEIGVLLDAACMYEAEPANFEDDTNTKRFKALKKVILKLQLATTRPTT